jgi:hypothetical protein
MLLASGSLKRNININYTKRHITQKRVTVRGNVLFVLILINKRVCFLSFSKFFVVVWLGFFFPVGQGLELRVLYLQSSALQHEQCLQSILHYLFWRWGSHELFAEVGLEL